jgi:hypothetical protein
MTQSKFLELCRSMGVKRADKEVYRIYRLLGRTARDEFNGNLNKDLAHGMALAMASDQYWQRAPKGAL